MHAKLFQSQLAGIAAVSKTTGVVVDLESNTGRVFCKRIFHMPPNRRARFETDKKIIIRSLKSTKHAFKKSHVRYRPI